ncbi:MAG: hypothetical protein LBJ95_01275 [Oscillospiraceae bacterium]|jgi:hypothetical protein|nr:hypothetical protein [Oscillospiraceae bacterium]
MRKVSSLFLAGTALFTLTFTVKADNSLRLGSDRTIELTLPRGSSNTGSIYVRLIANATGENLTDRLLAGDGTNLKKVEPFIANNTFLVYQVKSKSISCNPRVIIDPSVPPGHYELTANTTIDHFGVCYDAESTIKIEVSVDLPAG